MKPLVVDFAKLNPRLLAAVTAEVTGAIKMGQSVVFTGMEMSSREAENFERSLSLPEPHIDGPLKLYTNRHERRKANRGK